MLFAGFAEPGNDRDADLVSAGGLLLLVVFLCLLTYALFKALVRADRERNR